MTQAQRKLLGEIDRVLKKVQEGAKEFEDILRKVNTAASSNQKEKYETDLKKAIKKLQRYRDQIKTWTQSNVIKDKKALVEARKMIEANMEKFKVCEKEMKTKAFSKEGLQQAALAKDEDPNTETKKWIGKCLTKLRSQIDALDTEIEGLAAKKGKRSVEFVDRLERLKVLVKKHHYHEEALEQILRKLDNETVAKEDVDAIRDGVEYYIDSNQEADFYEDDQLYDELNLAHGAGGSLSATPDTSSPNSSNTTPSATPLSSSPPTSSGFPASFASAVASSLPSGGLRSSQVGLKNTRKKGEEDGENEESEEAREETAAVESKPEPAPAAKPERQETPTPAAAKAGPSHLPIPTPTTSLPIPTPAPAQKKLASSAPVPETMKRTARDVLLGSQPSATHHQPPAAAQQQPPSQPQPPAAQQPPAQPQVQQPLLHQPQPPQQQPAVSHQQPPALVATPSQPQQQRPAAGPTAASQAGQGTTSPRRGKASPTPPPEMPSQRMKEEELAVRSASAPPYQQHPAHHMPPSMMQPSAASPQLPSLMQLSQQQMGRQQYMQTLQEAAEDSKNLDTFDNSTPISSGSLADLSAASASLEMAAAAAARVEAGLSTQEDVSLAELGRVHGVHMPGGYPQQGMPPQHPQQGAQQQRQHQLQQQQLFNLKMLETSMENLPEQMDYENRPRQYTPQNAYPTPATFPQLPSTVFENPAIFSKFDTDTLFFIFYYQQGTYQQYLAARELKKQLWRYHKKYLTWFQRHEEPKEITNDYEQGTYVYFDYETGWCQRKKTEFTFEYRYLEEGE